MAAWGDAITLTAPEALDPLITGLESLATAADATLDVGETALDAAKVLLAGAASPEAAAAQALLNEAEELVTDIFDVGLYQVFAHPWQHGVGSNAGVFRSLSFPNCVQAIASSFDDQADLERPQFSTLTPMQMIVLIVGGPSPSIFSTTLTALNALIDSKEFRLAQRRLAQAFELQAARFSSVRGSRLPDWQSVTVRDVFPSLRPLEASLRENAAMLKGYASGGTQAVDIALALIEAKRAQLTTLRNNLATAAELFGQGLTGAGIRALHVSGAAGSNGLKQELLAATGAPGPELSFCAGVAWVGVAGTLDVLADSLSIA